MKKVGIYFLIGMMAIAFSGSVASASALDGVYSNAVYGKNTQQVQAWNQNQQPYPNSPGSPYCYGGGYGYQSGNGPNNGSYGGNGWNCW